MKAIMIRSPMSVVEKDQIGYGWAKVDFSEHENANDVIAKINEDLWSELFMGNKENLLKMINQFEDELDIIKEALKKNDLGTLKEKFIISTKRKESID